MLFNQGYHSSLPQKRFALFVLFIVIISMGLLMFLNPSAFSGDIMRRIVLLSCSVIYSIRLGVTFLIFLKRRLTWQETITVTIIVCSIIILFLYTGGNQPQPIGNLDIFGVSLFLGGSLINSYSEFQRHKWKQKPENKGLLYAQGLFKYSMHINYFGDIILFTGFSILTHNIFMSVIPLLIIFNFVFFYIPAMDKYLASKYGQAFQEYTKNTKKLIPMVY
jgi:steroid 5-alpha reductase family enzyme